MYFCVSYLYPLGKRVTKSFINQERIEERRKVRGRSDVELV